MYIISGFTGIVKNYFLLLKLGTKNPTLWPGTKM